MKDKILAESAKLLWKYGVRTITMDDIARRLGISKKTIYLHFSDKEDIVYQAVKHHIEHEMIECDRVMCLDMNPIDEMLLVSDMMRRQADAINPSLLMDVQRYYPKAWAFFLDHKEKRIINDIKANLKRGVEQGFYRSDINLDTMARLRVELVQLGFDDRIFPNNKDVKDVIATQEQLLHHFIRGILTEAGFATYNERVKSFN
ncbi:TetR/AcrR family transcriptional regulator [Fibrella sp. HMF5405]|uniref:TetR/AcrR family transcriptional regulator n=1 Tax=Fibrella forsythiae TaxID=2817061 RepID=A0ABS3JK20_9BACT|nr:TetR/AcrR family transcriptional regulator [Fibrella forsythiae]